VQPHPDIRKSQPPKLHLQNNRTSEKRWISLCFVFFHHLYDCPSSTVGDSARLYSETQLDSTHRLHRTYSSPPFIAMFPKMRPGLDTSPEAPRSTSRASREEAIMMPRISAETLSFRTRVCVLIIVLFPPMSVEGFICCHSSGLLLVVLDKIRGCVWWTWKCVETKT
jgi:hypothetical protein